MKNHVIITAILLLSCFPVFPEQGRDTFMSSVLATVNGTPITIYDVRMETGNEEQKLAMVYAGADLVREIEKLRGKKAMEIVARKLFYKEFKDKEYKIPDQYIEDMLDGLAENIAGGDRRKLEKKALEEGLSITDLRTRAYEKLAVDLLVNEFCYKTVFITPKELDDYYKSHTDEFSKAPQMELHVLLLKKDGRYAGNYDETLTKIKEDLSKADKSIFTTLVKLYSEGPDVSKGGNIGWIEETKLRKEFIDALKGAEKGKVVGPIQTPEGIYFIFVADKMASKSLPYEAVEEQLREKLSSQEKEARYNEYLDRLKKDAIIRNFFKE